MMDFFLEGGPGMYPVLLIGGLVLVSAGSYAYDTEPVRLRFLAVGSLALFVFMTGAILSNVAHVFWYLEDETRVPADQLWRTLFTGLKEASRPGLLGFLLWGVALVLVSVGVYRSGRRELKAARG